MVQPPVEANALPAGGFQKKYGSGNRDRIGALLGSGIGQAGFTWLSQRVEPVGFCAL